LVNNFFLAASPKMMEIHRQVKLLADTDLNVLILGESGNRQRGDCAADS
jgi:DNA-binding NtrC family response regulator